MTRLWCPEQWTLAGGTTPSPSKRMSRAIPQQVTKPKAVSLFWWVGSTRKEDAVLYPRVERHSTISLQRRRCEMDRTALHPSMGERLRARESLAQGATSSPS